MTGHPMAAVCRALHVARSTGYLRPRPRKGRFYRHAEDREVLYQILSVTKARASYGYRRTHRLVNREREAGGEMPYSRKRIRRVMRIAGLMLPGKKRPVSNQRSCSDGFNVPCWNGDVVRVAFALDCHDSEALGHAARARDLRGEDIRLLLDEALWSRFGERTLTAPLEIQWLSDNGGPYISTDSFVPSTIKLHLSRKLGGRADPHLVRYRWNV